jgi:hypothetical protein
MTSLPVHGSAFGRRTDSDESIRLTALFVRSALMKRLSPEERRHILHQTLVRLQKDWVCRYGRWNTAKMLREMRRLLRKASEPEGLEALGVAESPATDADEDLPLFDRL